MRMKRSVAVGSTLGIAALLGVACKTNNINATTNNEAQTFTVGPAAQDLVGPDSVEVDVPANAVATSIQVTLSVEATGFPALPSGDASAGNVFSFTPDGQTFAAQVTVKIPYTASGSGTPTLLTAEETDTTWTTVSGSSTTTSATGTFLTAQTSHFSFYTVVMSSGGGEGDGGATSGGEDSSIESPCAVPHVSCGAEEPDGGGCPKGTTCLADQGCCGTSP
jgi:hypothetical protein